MTLNEKLGQIQKELKAPKGNYNTFGKYSYRSAEDILEAVKPLLVGVTLTISDDIVNLGDRYYVKATSKLTDGKETIEVSALAREEPEQKGMNAAQITGSASSYARKYSLNGLFCIDDTKDFDATNDHGTKPPERVGKTESPKVAPKTEAPKTEVRRSFVRPTKPSTEVKVDTIQTETPETPKSGW
jgi:hypothetical protein